MQANDGIRFDGIFAAPNLEADYRLSTVAEDQRRARLTLILALILVPFFATMDVVFLGHTLHTYLILTVRSVIILVSAFLVFWLRRPRAPRELDRVLLAWEIMAS